MSDLIINNRLIETSIEDILKKLQSELTNGKLSKYESKNDWIRVQCPHHKQGKEKHCSCGIYRGNSSDIEYGTCHCFTCGFSGSLYHFIGECFDLDDDFGKEWLLNRYGNTYVEKFYDLPIIDLNRTKVETTKNNLQEQLDSFQCFHPYMTKRKLNQEICERFSVKYDSKSQCLVFPVWNEKDELVMFTRRSVLNKRFIIDENINKPVYLLNYIKKNNINSVLVCESQINCLYSWSLGYPAIALLGTGTKHQYDILNKSDIRHYILCFDGDEAGDKAIERFRKNIRKDVIIDVFKIPRGKDLNDLDETFVRNEISSI